MTYLCSKMGNYMDLADNQHHLWSRQCEYFDKALTEMLQAKLKATFDPSVWDEVFASSDEDFDTERRMLLHQHASVDQKMQAVINNTNFIQSQSFLEALEREYTNLSQEKARLESKLTDLANRENQQDSLADMAKQAQHVLASWDELDIETKRMVAQSFISRMVVTPMGKHKPLAVEIFWKDDTSDSVQIAYRSDGSTIWYTWEVELLTQLLEEEADQVTMCGSLPDRNWNAIRQKIYDLIGKRNFHISPKPIHDEEKYEDYLARLERDGEKANRTSGNRWRNNELEVLEELLNRQATQLEISAALPIRTWEAIRKKITKLRGRGVIVPETGHLENDQTIYDYLEQHPETAAAMPFSILMNSSRQISQNKKHHRSGLRRLNVVVLIPSSVLRAG